jgi:hypothetical protein
MGDLRQARRLCKGKGGSMHIADLDKGMMGANGILGGRRAAGLRRRAGGQVPRQATNVAISFVGDGASNQGTIPRSLNLAAVWNLPAIFVVENNGYAEAPAATTVACGRPTSIARRLRHARRHRRRHRFLRRARSGRRDHRPCPRRRRPGAARMQDGALLRPLRRRQQTYRAPGELADIRANQDCLKKFAAAVTSRRRRHARRTRSHRPRGEGADRRRRDAGQGSAAAAAGRPDLTDVYVSVLNPRQNGQENIHGTKIS